MFNTTNHISRAEENPPVYDPNSLKQDSDNPLDQVFAAKAYNNKQDKANMTLISRAVKVLTAPLKSLSTKVKNLYFRLTRPSELKGVTSLEDLKELRWNSQAFKGVLVEIRDQASQEAGDDETIYHFIRNELIDKKNQPTSFENLGSLIQNFIDRFDSEAQPTVYSEFSNGQITIPKEDMLHILDRAIDKHKRLISHISNVEIPKIETPVK